MAKVGFKGKTHTDPEAVRALLGEFGIRYERWGVRDQKATTDDEVLVLYKPEVDRLKSERGYATADMIALRPDTPNLETILAKFDKEHHHTADEVRFTVEGEGVFELCTPAGENLVFTSEPGDLIVIPAMHRHLFYLTPKKTIRTIRMFRDMSGWEAIYPRPG